jgi:hypothetical protein
MYQALFCLIFISIVVYIIYDKHTKDNYTSAQPPPPLSNVITQYGRPIAGIDCTSDCPPDAYYGYPRYPIYDLGYRNDYRHNLGYRNDYRHDLGYRNDYRHDRNDYRHGRNDYSHGLHGGLHRYEHTGHTGGHSGYNIY